MVMRLPCRPGRARLSLQPESHFRGCLPLWSMLLDPPQNLISEASSSVSGEWRQVRSWTALEVFQMLLKTAGCSPLLLFTPPSLVPTTVFPSLTFLPGFPVLSPQPPVPLPHCPFASASVSSILASSLPSAEMPEDPLTHVPDSPHMRRSSPAVHNGGASLRGLVQPLPQHLPEGQHGVCGVGDAMVWPSHVMELSHRQRFLLLHLE